MSQWDALESELDRWAASEAVATLWWRDDDAYAPTPALDRLLSLSHGHHVPLGLAVIPAKAEDGLVGALRPPGAQTVLQHGFAHANHAPPGEKKAEFGEHRPLQLMSGEIIEGRRRLETLAGERFLPLLVPPWNRLAPSLIALLSELGFRGLSAFSPRPTRLPAPNLVQINAHVDLIDWRGGRVFKGTRRLAGEIAGHLSARRVSQVDAEEPTGIISHHLIHDEACWRFLDELFDRTSRREGVRWLTPAEGLDLCGRS